MVWIIIIFVVVFVVVLAKNRGKSRGGSTRFYANVFIYNGEFRSSVYLCKPSYYVSQIVVVNYKGQEYAGRIVDIFYERPRDIPKDVVFKEIIKPFEKSDMNKVAYWNDSIENATKN